MDPPKSFPILRLPFLAIEEVFKTMNPFEIINFSIISKRTKGIAKQMSFYPRYAIELFINETLEIRLHGTKNVVSFFYVMTSDEKMNGKIEEKQWGRFITRREFKYDSVTIDLLSMTIDVFIGQNVSIIDFLKANVKSVDRCILSQIDNDIHVDKHIAYFLNNMKINSELCSDVYIKSINFNGKFPSILKELYINNSQWIGFEKSLNIDCKSVIFMKNQTRNVNLRNNHIFGEQWNSFLKKWIAMETHVNLEYLELEYRDFVDFNADVLYDIPHEVVDKGVKRVLKTRRNKTKKIRGMIDIKRIDGKTATIFVYRVLSEKRFAMSIH
ncbi:hypothetical protein CRE_15129 [Caenorhabditis remanei]|uniref:F-box domain-containing protein n=1 Tax=Caenorhabditis remanei TaxID=31234 RepID=E3NRI1_CAERE|nr:hypothetical protein CRE_15129 [Caenorhabditis remanei]